MGVLLPWFAAMGFQTWRDVTKQGRPPLPSEFIASGAAFAALGFLSQANARLAATLAWGLLLAIAFQVGPDALVNPGPAGQGTPNATNRTKVTPTGGK